MIISSQLFGHLRSFKGWIQTEACVIPRYHRMLIMWQEQPVTVRARDIEENRDLGPNAGKQVIFNK